MSRLIASRMLAALIMGALFATPATQAQTTWYVDDDAPNDPGPGDPTVSDPNENGSAEHPFDAIQEGVDAAVDGDEVLVANGTYTADGNKRLDYAGKLITVRAQSTRPRCIIDCEGDGPAFVFQTGETSEAVVNGFRIKHVWAESNRGAIHCDEASPTIANCWLTENLGPAIRAVHASPVVSECTIKLNSGAAIRCFDSSVVISDCTISDNVADPNCAPGCLSCRESDVTITHCVIKRNIGDWGGGVTGWGGQIRIHDCRIADNFAAGFAGGVATEGTDVTITNCTITGNVGEYYGGGGVTCLYGNRVTVANCVIAGNTASSSRGGGFFCYDNAPVLANCTLVGNSSAEFGGGMYCGAGSSATIVNCVFWANSAPQGPQIAVRGWPGGRPAALSARYSDVEDGEPGVDVEEGSTLIWGDGNIDADPLFVDPFAGDYRLGPGSPCIDAGCNCGVPPDTADLDGDGDPNEPLPLDLDGRLRFGDRIDTPDTGNPDPDYPELEIVDMGAYEYQCTGDLNGDGVIGLSDLATLLASYRTGGAAVYPDGDLDQDGDVDLSDLAALLAVYRTTCD